MLRPLSTDSNPYCCGYEKGPKDRSEEHVVDTNTSTGGVVVVAAKIRSSALNVQRTGWTLGGKTGWLQRDHRGAQTGRHGNGRVEKRCVVQDTRRRWQNIKGGVTPKPTVGIKDHGLSSVRSQRNTNSTVTTKPVVASIDQKQFVQEPLQHIDRVCVDLSRYGVGSW